MKLLKYNNIKKMSFVVLLIVILILISANTVSSVNSKRFLIPVQKLSIESEQMSNSINLSSELNYEQSEFTEYTSETELEEEEENDEDKKSEVKDKSRHEIIANSILSRIKLYEGSIVYLVNNIVKDKLQMSLVNNDFVNALKPIFSCATKRDSLKKLRDDFNNSFKDGLTALSAFGDFKANESDPKNKLVFNLKSDFRNESGKCEEKENDNKKK